MGFAGQHLTKHRGALLVSARNLYQVCYDCPWRFVGRTQYFEYKEVAFKLVQSKSWKRPGHLLSIIEREGDRERHFAAAAEFVSALAWERRTGAMVWEVGLLSWRPELSLRNARPSMYSLPRIPYEGGLLAGKLSRLPDIATEEQRVALGLMREARATNNQFLAFLFFWRVLEIAPRDAAGQANRVFRKAAHGVDPAWVEQLPLAGRSLGNYLYDDCRNAVAHLFPNRGTARIDVDRPSDRVRFEYSLRVVEALAEAHIETDLGLDKKRFLRRRGKAKFPFFELSQY